MTSAFNASTRSYESGPNGRAAGAIVIDDLNADGDADLGAANDASVFSVTARSRRT